MKIRNSAKNILIIFFILFILAVILIFVPWFMGMDGMNGGFAVSLIAFFLAIVFLIVSIVYYPLSKRSGRMLELQNILVHWEYEKKKWLEHAGKEYLEEKKQKRFLAALISGITFIVALFFIIFQRDTWMVMGIVFLSITLLMFFLAWITPLAGYKKSRKISPEAIISQNGAYLTGQFHYWNILTSKLKDAVFEPSLMLVIIIYTYSTNTGESSYELKIPVPAGKEKAAEEAVRELLMLNDLR